MLTIVLLVFPGAGAQTRRWQGQYGPETPAGWVDAAPAPESAHIMDGMALLAGAPFVALGLPNDHARNWTGTAPGRVLWYNHETAHGELALAQTLTAPLGSPGHFGRALSASSAGIVVSAGDDHHAAVYLYAWGNAGPYAVPSVLPVPSAPGLDVGAAVDTAQGHSDRPDEGQIAIGAPSTSPDRVGSAFVLRSDSTGTWTVAAILNGTSPGFGSAVRLDGDELYIGSPGGATHAGQVFVYALTRLGAGAQQVINAPHDEAGFGAAIAPDWYRLLVGSPADGSGNGTAYLYARSDPTKPFRLSYPVVPPEEAVPPAYGSAVAADGGIMAIAAPTESGTTGGIYRFVGSNDVGTYQGRFAAPMRDGAGRFATQVAVGGGMDFVTTLEPAPGSTCAPAFVLGAIDPDAPPWRPCSAPTKVFTTSASAHPGPSRQADWPPLGAAVVVLGVLVGVGRRRE